MGKWLLASGLLLLVVVGGKTGIGCDRTTPEQRVALLLKDGRPFAGRPSLALDHAPQAPLTKDPGGMEQAEAALALEGEKPRPTVLQARAAYYLARAEPGDLARAEDAARSEPDGWEQENDLALVLLARDEPEDALDHLERAAAVGGRAVAAFNRPIVYAALGLQLELLEALKRCEAEAGEGWAGECATRRAELERPVPFAADDRTRLREALLDARSPGQLGPLRAGIGALSAAGDSLLQRQLDILDHLDAAGWAAWAREVSDLLQAIARIRAKQAVDLSRFEASQHPLVEIRARHYHMFTAILAGATQPARRAIQALRSRAEQLGAAEEAAVAISDEGTMFLRERDFVRADALWGEALRRLPRTSWVKSKELLGKRADLALAKDLPLEARALIREDLRGDQEPARFLRPGSFEGEPYHLVGAASGYGEIFGMAARYAQATGWDAAARVFLREAAARFKQSGSPPSALNATAKLAEVLSLGGEAGAAIALLEPELEALPDVPANAGTRARLESALAEALAARGNVHEARTVAQAAAIRSVACDSGIQDAALLAQARVLLAAGELPQARAAAEEALRIERGTRTSGPLDRLLLERDNAGSVALLARILAAAGEQQEAFAVAAGGWPRSLDPHECRIAVLNDRDHLLVLTDSASGARLDDRVIDTRQFRRVLVREPRQLGRLVGSAIGPGRCPTGTTRLGFVETSYSLGDRLPFDAKREHPEVTVAVLTAGDRAWPAAQVKGPALVLRDPALPASAGDAAALRSSIGTTDEWVSTEVRVEEVASALPRYGLVHFALHGVGSPHLGAASSLGLGSEQVLTAERIMDLQLDRNPLVVLAACRTAGFSGLDPAGGLLPRAFIKAGAVAVVASDADIRDETASRYTADLYRRLGSGQDLVAAHDGAVAELAAALGPEAYSFMLFF